MKLSRLLTFNAVIALAFGGAFPVVPSRVIALFGAAPDPQINFVGQVLGVELIHVGLIAWLVRQVADGHVQRAIILAFLISAAIGLVVSSVGTVSGVLNAMGWSVVALYVVLLVGYGYFQFRRPRPN